MEGEVDGIAGTETFSQRPGALRSLWRIARSLTKRQGPDPRAALGPGARVEGVRLETRDLAPYAALCGFEEGTVPITFPHMLAFPLHIRVMTRAEFPYQIMGAVHLENSIRQHATLATGDALDMEARPSRLLRHSHGQVVEIETTASRDGEPVWDSRSLYFFRGKRGDVGDPYVPSSLTDGASELDERARWTLPESIGRSYARVSGDWNPIHLSRATAKLFGQQNSIAHGMWMKARAVAAITAPLRASNRVVSVTVAFRTPAFLPGAARFFAGVGHTDNIFELRDAKTPRKLLRGRLRLCAP
jgi:acyl dehydratase